MSQIQRSFRVAQIVYFTDLSRGDAPAIALGSLAELVLPHMRGLGLKARTGLTGEELASVSPLIRDRFSSPFAFLKAEFDAAWANVRGTRDLALDGLARRHAASLSILAPTEYCNAEKIMKLELPARQEMVIAELNAAIGHEYEALQHRFNAKRDDTESVYHERQAA